MGRSAKHLSLAEKASANRESTSKYSRSPQGQTTRAASRRPAHRRKCPLPPPRTLSNLPTPTPRMLELSNQALPFGSPLFKQALRSADALDESDLPRWKEAPPFVEDDDAMDPYSAGYLAFTKSLAEVLHGVRLRDQNARDIELRMGVSTKGLALVMHGLQEEVAKMWVRWERAEELLSESKYHPYHQSREHTMLLHHVQWLARTICHLYYLKFLE
ncbi:hypothetical protein DFH07DRAFT_770410 [Mycena maculata]|uniref:Uncharacterized protein n=1 Tax=Mycena maculata TaxID=230809 RepID=A0AAD7NKD0_9AGAR|nr:hypothetical protein DFH07DRAFT_770410 [Mycena maculata]